MGSGWRCLICRSRLGMKGRVRLEGGMLEESKRVDILFVELAA